MATKISDTPLPVLQQDMESFQEALRCWQDQLVVAPSISVPYLRQKVHDTEDLIGSILTEIARRDTIQQ